MDVKFTSHKNEVLTAKERAFANALEAIGMTAEGYAKELTPVVTGRLRNSIAHDHDGDSAYIGSNVEYAPMVELGGAGKRKAHHMLQRAASEHTEEYKQIVKNAMENA